MRRALEAWLCEGRAHLETTLRARRDRASVPAATIVGTQVSSCFHWLHMPSPNDSNVDTVAIVFTNDTDLSLWRQSPQRQSWLASGVARGLAQDDKSIIVDAEKIPLQKDDGSLGGWMPSAQAASSGRQDLVPPPPSWKVAATVLLAMYPMQEANRLVLLPWLASTQFATLPPTVQMFATCAWTCGVVSVALLPRARAASERIGFIGGQRGCPDAAALTRAGGRLMLLYAGLVSLGVGASAVVAAAAPRQDHPEGGGEVVRTRRSMR